MRVLPIPFSAPMVRAILREIEQPGTGKTMTRRALKWGGEPPVWCGDGLPNNDPRWWGFRYYDKSCDCTDILSLPGALRIKAGDRLWVREGLQCDWMVNILTGERETNAAVAYYAADDTDVLEQRGFNMSWEWKRGTLPARFMPRWASRITLLVTDVRVERLQDISEADAMAEGIQQFGRFYGIADADWEDAYHSSVSAFRHLWNSLNASREGGKYAWAKNPWVSVTIFRPILGNIDQVAEAA